MSSLEKLTALIDACREIGVETGPKTVENLGIIPLYSWYHKVILSVNTMTKLEFCFSRKNINIDFSLFTKENI